MADDEKVSLRDLPAVEPVEVYGGGKRMSQTLASKLDTCPRSGYLYMKHSGGPTSHPMMRGTLVHLFAERMTFDLIRMGEKNLYEAQFHQVEGSDIMVEEDVERAQKAVASLTSTMIDELLAEHPELCCSTYEVDQARIMAYHLAIGWDIDPATILGVERKFVLDLDCGVTLSGKIDLCCLPATPGWLHVRDYKTAHPRRDDTGIAMDPGEAYAVPTEQEFDEEKSFQLKFYAVLVKYGVPVENRPCPDCGGNGHLGGVSTIENRGGGHHESIPCDVCHGRGKVEVRLDPVGDAVRWVRADQVYPRAAPVDRGNGVLTLVTRDRSYTMQELADFRYRDLERIGLRLLGGMRTWKFPAVPSREGGYCNECPAPYECPLPSKLRRYAGAVNTHDQAAEALAWALTQQKRVSATVKEVRAWAKANGPIVMKAPGTGATVYGFTIKPNSRRFKTRKGKSRLEDLLAAVEEKSRYGTDFDLGEFVLEGGTKNVWGDLPWTEEDVEARLEDVSRVEQEEVA